MFEDIHALVEFAEVGSIARAACAFAPSLGEIEHGRQHCQSAVCLCGRVAACVV
jgi:hypothetical protein